MNCPKCNTSNIDNAKFCTNCGYAFNSQQVINNDEESYTVITPKNNYTRTNMSPPPQKKKNNTALIIVLVIVGIFILGGIASAFNKDDDKKEKTETSSASTSSQSSKSTSSTDKTQQSSKANEEPSESSIKEDPQKTEADFKKECKTYTYKEIARNPSNYQGTRAKFEGQVVQVVENGDDLTMRVEITKKANQFADNGYLYSDPIYVEYKRKNQKESRILEDDIIMMYGYLNGTKSYDTVLGANQTIPYFKAQYIDIISP
jgi:hypothetical protein